MEHIYAKRLFLALNWPFLRKHDNPIPSINFHDSLVKKTMCYSQIHKSHIHSIKNLKFTKFQGFNPIKIGHKDPNSVKIRVGCWDPKRTNIKYVLYLLRHTKNFGSSAGWTANSARLLDIKTEVGA